MTGPMVTCASGKSSFTAYASRCAVEWRMSSRPSGSLAVTIATLASEPTAWLMSTSLPSTLPPSAALARPGPIEAAISPTVTGLSYFRTDPSGRVMLTMSAPKRKKRGRAALFRNAGRKRARLPRTSGARRWRSHNHCGPFLSPCTFCLVFNDNSGIRPPFRGGEDARQRSRIEWLHQVAVESGVERLAAVLLGALPPERDEVD